MVVDHPSVPQRDINEVGITLWADPHIVSFLTRIRQVYICIVKLPTKTDDGK